MKKKSEINIENELNTVPAYFDSNQKDLIEKIENSEFKKIRLLNEQTAASFDYDIIQNENEKKFLDFDFGCGTYDITLLKINGNIFSDIFKLRNYFLEKIIYMIKKFSIEKKIKKIL